MDDIKVALKAGDKKRVGALRLIVAEIKRKEIDSQTELDDAATAAVLEKMAKQRRESIKHFADAKRDDLLEQEQFELDLITGYLPEALSGDQIAALVEQAIEQCGATEMKQMGAVMAAIKSGAQGRVDMGEASRLVRARLK